MEATRKQILRACQMLDERQFVANHDGNVSVRTGENEFIVTPTAFAKRDIQDSDLLRVDFDGKVLEGKHKIFSEWKFHRAIYLANPAVSSVCHAHPPYAMALGLLGKSLGFASVPEAIVSLGGPIETISSLSILSSDDEIERGFSSVWNSVFACLVSGNGVFAVGDDASMSSLRVELVEQVVRAQMIADGLGHVKSLPHSLVQSLLEKRPPLKPKWSAASSGASVSAASRAVAASASPENEMLEKVKSIIRKEVSGIF